MEAFYAPLGGDRYAATRHTVGPWSADSQHLGPPSALLVRELERLPGSGPAGSGLPGSGLPGSGQPGPGLLARVAFDVLGPVPVAELVVSASVVRPGRSVELLAAVLSHEGRPVLRASAWRIAPGDTASVASGQPEPLPPPSACAEFSVPGDWACGYLEAVEWRSVSGGLATPGGAAVWGRPRVPVVAGEEPSAAQRLFTVADSASGVSTRLDIRRWYAINTELTVHLHREPVGEWFALDAETVVGPTGVGVAGSTVHDLAGAVGRTAQALFVRER